MAKTTVEVEIVAILKEAKKVITGFADTTQKQLDSINMKASVSAIADGMRIIEQTAGRAFGLVKEVIGDAISEASQGEEAMTRLANSMRLVGDFSNGAAEDMKEFADELQRTTTNSDDAVLSALAVAKNFNLTNKEAKAATAAAADFAAATGIDLETAVSKLSRSFNGLVDKDLARYLPALKSLSKEQLVLGEATRIVGDRFAGFAAALGGTFNGAIVKAQHAFDDLLEAIGEIIINNNVVIESIQIVGETFGALKGEVEGSKSALNEFVADVVKGLASFAPIALQIAKTIDGVVSAVINLFKTLGIVYGGIASTLVSIASGDFAGARDTINSLVPDILKNYGDTQKKLGAFYDPLINSAREASDKIQKLGLVPNKKSQIELKVNKSDAQIIADRMRDALSEGADELKKKLQEAFDKQKQLVTDIAANPFKLFIPTAQPGGSREFSSQQEGYIAAGAGIAANILKGAEGARETISALAGAFADYLIPGLGPVIKDLVDSLSKGPDHVRKMVNEFEKAIPELIENITNSLPAMFETIVDNMPFVIQKSIEMIPKIFSAWLRFLPDLFNKIIAMLPEIIQAFVKGFIKAIPEIFVAFGQALYDSAAGFVEALLSAATDVGGALGIGGGGGGDSRGIVETILDPFDIFGLAAGGSVPDRSTYSGDGYGPVMLDGGEEVLDRSTAAELRAFLRNEQNGGEKQPDIVINVGLQQFARLMFDARRAGYQT